MDFHEIEQLQSLGNWEQAARILVEAAKNVEAAGAEGLLICTNTMHKVAPAIEKAISIPLLHIADATADQLIADGISRVGLLGTAFTMEQDFYKKRLSERYEIDVLIPDDEQRDDIHRVIYHELCQGIILDDSRTIYEKTIQSLKQQGAEAIILGCTEIGLLIQQAHSELPLYDTTAIHADKAVRWALGNDLPTPSMNSG